MEKRRHVDGAMHAWVLVASTAAAMLVPALRTWPWYWVAPLAAYAIVAFVSSLRASFRPWRFGVVSLPAALATAVIVIGSCAVLIGFQAWRHPDLSVYGGILPTLVAGSVLVTGLIFAIGNALLEELIFRGILFDAIESQWGVTIAVLGTALLFGYGHLRGYPPGPLGAILAGVYGLCLGWLRTFTGGLGWPVLAHITADATIFAIVTDTLP